MKDCQHLATDQRSLPQLCPFRGFANYGFAPQLMGHTRKTTQFSPLVSSHLGSVLLSLSAIRKSSRSILSQSQSVDEIKQHAGSGDLCPEEVGSRVPDRWGPK